MPDWRLEIIDEIASTNDTLIERAIAGEPGRCALLAHRQFAGRGRRGRRWVGPDGNLAMSALLRPHWPTVAIGRVVFAAGLALRDTLQSFATDGRHLTLKWPNDVLLDDAKLAGILVESEADQSGVRWLVIGFGANLAQAPQLGDRRTACLAQMAAGAPGAETVAQRLLDRLDDWIGLMESHGFDEIRRAWMAAAHPLGTMLMAGGRRGYFAGLSDDGGLLLGREDGLETFTAGEAVLVEQGRSIDATATPPVGLARARPQIVN